MEEAECVASLGQAVKGDGEERQLPWYTERQSGRDVDNAPTQCTQKFLSTFVHFKEGTDIQHGIQGC